MSTSTGLTGAGHFMGTLDYISPERIEGHQADGRADQYALACSAFEMLTGAPPFRSPEAAALMYAQLSQPPPPLTSRRPDLPAAADQVFARGWPRPPGIATRAAGNSRTPCARRSAWRPTILSPNPSRPQNTRRPQTPAAPAAPAGRNTRRPGARPRPPGRTHPLAARPPTARRGRAPPRPLGPPGTPRPLRSRRGARRAVRSPGAVRSPRRVRPPAPARRRPSRRAVLAALAAVLVLAAAAIGAYILHGGLSSRPLTSIPIAAAPDAGRARAARPSSVRGQQRPPC